MPGAPWPARQQFEQPMLERMQTHRSIDLCWLPPPRRPLRGKRWFTPWSALLKGTIRTKLIERNLLYEEEIRVEDISSFESFKLINAMIEFDSPEIEVSNIVF